MKRRTALVAIGLSAVAFPLFALAQKPSNSAPSSDVQQIAQIAEWVRQQGHDDLIHKEIVAAFDLKGDHPNGDLSVRLITFGGEVQGTSIHFCLFEGSRDIIMVRRDYKVKRGIYWLIRDGVLINTVEDTVDAVQLVPNDRWRPASVIVKNYFFTHLPPAGAASVNQQSK